MALVAELQKEVVGGKVVSTEFYKKRRAAYFFVKKGNSRRAFGFVYHPAGYGTFVVPTSKVKIDTSEKPWPIFKLEGANITQVEQFGFDRIFQILVHKDEWELSIVVEALGPNGNIWLLDKDSVKLATLRKRKFNDGDRYMPPPESDRLNPLEISIEAIRDRIVQKSDASLPLPLFLEKNILGFNRTLAKETMMRAGLDFVDLQSMDDGSLDALIKSISDTVARFERPEVGYLYNVAGQLEVYPFKLSSVEQQPEQFKSLSLAVLAMTSLRQTQVETVDEEKRIKDALKRTLKRLERRRAKVQQDVKDASDYEEFKKKGELLQINFDRIKKGMSEITVADAYVEPHVEMIIHLDPALSPADNVEAYFKKLRKAHQGLQLLQRRLVITEKELERITAIQSELEEDFGSARSRYEREIATLLPTERLKQQIQPRLPFREYILSAGLRIFVGRGGSDNDRTTFEFAKPYELWFHAQQCPGSHVVMKFPNKSFEPSKREIEETAAIAAYFSKAKSDSLAPVIYTQRRYVRKPRRTKSGLVTVEREKSIMVAPRKPSRSE